MRQISKIQVQIVVILSVSETYSFILQPVATQAYLGNWDKV